MKDEHDRVTHNYLACATCLARRAARRDAHTPTRGELVAELEALEAERDFLVLEVERVRRELDS